MPRKPPAADPKKNPAGSFVAAGGVAAAIAAAADGTDPDGKPKLPTFKGVAYTGQPMTPEGWYTPVVIDLAGVKVPKEQRPALRQHDHNRVVGHTTAVKVTDAGIEVEGVVSNPESEQAREVVATSRNGFQWQLSIGANPIRTEDLESGKTATVNGREVTGPMTISRETELGEFQFRSARRRRGHPRGRSGF
jgi:hypothetical protein